MTMETQESIGRWAVDTFGGEPGLTPRHCIRLLEEVVELCLAQGSTQQEILDSLEGLLDHFPASEFTLSCPEPDKVLGEMADCAIVLDTLAHRAGIDLQAEKDRKMAVNRARRWRENGDGTGYHVKDEEKSS
jgi:NTP pyrophosphatase (non-canonical NTP hydrolase)